MNVLGSSRIQFETVGELRDAVHATSLFADTTSEHSYLLSRLVFDPVLWTGGGRQSRPDEFALVSTFYIDRNFKPAKVVDAIGRVVNAKRGEFFNPQPLLPMPNWLNSYYTRRQREIAKRFRPVIEALE